MKTIIRFFVYNWDNCDCDVDGNIEVDETTFLQFDGEISYERHTMFENGIDQVCLTKGLPEG